ncbi:MAG: hypothetical protein HOG89_04890 [Candidatus Peribacter sp.]|jgi:hypothetical protein|nr:hypothetical protein [Candidatus Peribacter sp.]MBT4393040.1 hypothetical protein [Candidatus Peribacter sp.]MBT4600391.1 hypothetical protein [Candidatus Peribacter sp.]MBT5149349.1 hypothetical protein [Candidatus Peribacter sp.]MBT5637588.1 hypothetical protein [Candidatus Peribacter sp.]
MYIKYPHSLRKNLKLLATGVACIVGSFLIGIQTAGDVQPVSLIQAGGAPYAGDVDGSGTVDMSDVLIILEVAQGYNSATTDQLKADPNADGQLTVDDAISILSKLSLQ